MQRSLPTLLLLLALACAPLVACGDDDDPAPAPTADAGAEDTAPDAPDAAPEDAADAPVEDTAPDAPAEDTAPDAPIEEPCPAPPEGEPPAGGRWALSLFHFNIQYVAGGLEGYAAVALGLTGGAGGIFDLDAEQVEDRIITESLDPVLEILERNPELALTFEMQGYMVDVIRARHPETLRRMRTLANAGQLELASIHWSDQFFLAWGPQDMDASWQRTQASFAAADLPLSRAVFTQEGQFGEGFAGWLVGHRPDAVMVMPRNLLGFYQKDVTNAPLWDVSGLDVVIPRGSDDPRVELQWTFFDDGELLATNDLNPYLGTQFTRHEPSLREYERRLQCLAQSGWKVGRVADYTDAVKAAGVEPRPMPPFLDGTWQPRSTRGPLRWLGGAGQVSPQHERDHAVLLACADARAYVLALQTALDDAASGATPDDRDALDDAWRSLLLGQVSDARGVNPWQGEVRYALEHCAAARQQAYARLQQLAARRGAAFLDVDTRAATVTDLADQLFPEPWEPEPNPPQVLTIAQDGGRAPQITWTRSPSAGPSVWAAEITWPPVPGAQATYDACLSTHPDTPWTCDTAPEPIVIHLARTPGHIAYRPALQERLVTYAEADFQLQDEATTDAAWTVAGDGLVGLRDDLYALKDTLTVHLAIGFPAGEGRNAVVELRDETLPDRDATTWRLLFTPDRDAAEALASRNLRPRVTVPAP